MTRELLDTIGYGCVSSPSTSIVYSYNTSPEDGHVA
jgi:hypothetical protein